MKASLTEILNVFDMLPGKLIHRNTQSNVPFESGIKYGAL